MSDEPRMYCLCDNVWVPERLWEAHLSSDGHLAWAKLHPDKDALIDRITRDCLCGMTVFATSWKTHLESASHLEWKRENPELHRVLEDLEDPHKLAIMKDAEDVKKFPEHYEQCICGVHMDASLFDRHRLTSVHQKWANSFPNLDNQYRKTLEERGVLPRPEPPEPTYLELKREAEKLQDDVIRYNIEKSLEEMANQPQAETAPQLEGGAGADYEYDDDDYEYDDEDDDDDDHK